MASLQEEAWRTRVKDATERAGHINGLSSLALVNKEFRVLAAKEQFKVLSSSRASLPIFRYRILPRFGHHITDVRFMKSDAKSDMDTAFTAMGQLPALCTLRFDKTAATELFGAGVTLRDDLVNEPANLRAEMLASIALRISTLVLQKFKPIEAVALIRRCGSSLRTLALVDLGPGNLEDQKALVGAIASARKLDSLSVSGADFTGWPQALAPLERDPPPIKKLQLFKCQLGGELHYFISLFASTVKILFLHALRGGLPAASVTRLPHLTHLSLCVDEEQLRNAIQMVTPSTLSHFSLVLYDADFDLTDAAGAVLLPFLTSQATLQRIELNGAQSEYPITTAAVGNLKTPPSVLAAYADLLDARGLDPSVLARPHLTPFDPKADLNYTENEAGYLENALGRTLDFGKLELRRMIAEGNIAGAVEWVELLKPIEAKRLAWMD
ncbi:hypothetical protein RQP46_003335 [Phenoliferia psychrophenolica]